MTPAAPAEPDAPEPPPPTARRGVAMDRSVSPWHALESAPASPSLPTEPARDRPIRWPLVGAALAAVGFALVAIALVVSGPRPAAVVGVGVDPIAAIDPASAAPSGAPAGATSGAASASGSGTILVDVSGAVRRPGLVRLPRGSRVADAIDAAGGLGPRVDAQRVDRELNLAAPVADGDHILVPSRDDAAPASGGSSGTSGTTSAPAASSGRVDLNHATSEALDTLPGIGPATAAKIVAARAERPFRTLDELVSRKVLGQATLAKIRDLVELR